MTVIRQQDLIDSVEDALQYISYYHPLDFLQALKKARPNRSKPIKGSL